MSDQYSISARLYWDLDYLRTLLHEHRENQRRADTNNDTSDASAFAFCRIYLNANQATIRRILDSVYSHSDEELRKVDPHAGDQAWRASHRANAEHAIRAGEWASPPDFETDDDWLNMLMRALRIAEALQIARSGTLFLSPAAKFIESLDRDALDGLYFDQQ